MEQQGLGSQSGEIQLQPINIAERFENAQCHPVDDGNHIVNLDHVTKCCVECAEPLEWVMIGRCGHRVVCPKCMVRIRFFHQNKRCRICKTYCFRVVVTKIDADAATMSRLPLFAFWEGRVGEYWYHRHTAAYFDDEKEYDMAKNACKGFITPFYKPVFWFIMWHFVCIVIGAAFGSAVANETNNMLTQVRAYAVSASIGILFGFIFWIVLSKCTADPLHIETNRQEHQNYIIYRERMQVAIENHRQALSEIA